MRQINLNRQLLGLEDFLFGFGQVTQTRGGSTVNITKINAGNMPFSETQSLLEWTQTVNLEVLGNMTNELQAIYDSIDALNNLDANLDNLNLLALNINCLNNLCANISKLQNIDTNMVKLQNIDSNMTELQNIDSNMLKLQNIDSNMAELQSIYTNMNELQSIYSNLLSIVNVSDNITDVNIVSSNITKVNNVSDNIAVLVNIDSNMSDLSAINSQVIPHLSEILLVDDYANQVTVDKGIVAADKADIASMKLAVETIYDTFDDRFLGVKTTDPLVDNDGNPLVDGAMYFNTSSNTLKVYDLGNTLWVTIPQLYLSGLLDVTLTSITTGDILNWDGSKWVNTRTPSFTSIKLTGGTGTAGTMTWNNTDFTYDIILNSDVTLQDGQEVLVPCVNSSASLISNGRPVMAVGTNGNSGNILVNLHDGAKANAKRAMGLATQNMSANNGFGFVTMIGKVRGINTTGSLYGETWADGDILYVKATGNLTKVVPTDSELKMGVAFVLHAHTNGTLYVRFTGVDENADKEFITSMVDIHSKTLKITPVDADEIMVADSASTFSLKKLTWANIKATLANLFISKVTSTDNAIVRFDGTTGAVQNSGVIIDDNNNVTIGNGTNTHLTVLNGANSGVGAGAAIGIKNNGVDIGYIGNYSATVGGAYSNDFGIYYANKLRIHTTGADRVTVDSAGNVGIGTSNPISQLHVYGGTNHSLTIDGITSYTSSYLGANGRGIITAHGNNTVNYICSADYGSPLHLATFNASSTAMVTGAKLTNSGDFLLTSGTGGLGYGTGAGGTVTQLTSKSTAVTLNKPSGQIAMNNAALAAGTSVTFTFNNSLIQVVDTIYPVPVYTAAGAWNYIVTPSDYTTGSCKITVWNKSGSALSEMIPITFVLIKGAIA